jgi:hypothetical protein
MSRRWRLVGVPRAKSANGAGPRRWCGTSYADGSQVRVLVASPTSSSSAVAGLPQLGHVDHLTWRDCSSLALGFWSVCTRIS